ncbi:sialidase family protein [Pseudoalteromonas byunsanensis]|uniref:Sialidase domain-containing protein n=1 Tax=Pseudoalteromonas byunsanensis TaxID=327939 RepID=A0A1S1N9U9_9GAMM|nr:sialidase family protein [Pseudoalteromonas byunsanensis]OHU96789.1 hypothetical protein BIW53_05555 [Pseudoalteromonas byunsanensis]
MFDHLNTNKKLVCIAVAMSLLSACGGGESGSATPTPDTETGKNTEVSEITFPLRGVAVKGPLQFADVKIYQFDKLAPNGLGKLLGTAETDATTNIRNLSLKGELQDFFVIEYSANERTVDITSGKKPVFDTLRGIFSAAQIKAKQPLYATPLSTLTVKLALSKTISGLGTSQAINDAENEIKSLFSFGMDQNVSLLTTPPLLTDATVESIQQQNAWYVRTVNEINAALVHQLRLAIADNQLSVDRLLDELVSDLKDGKLDAQSDTDSLPYNKDNISVLLTPIHTLNIPGTELQLMPQLARVMAEETTVTGNSTLDTSAMTNPELMLRHSNILMSTDIDGDGINNANDLDNDNDGIIDDADADDDNDSYNDTLDAFPLDPTEWLDTDSDGLGNNTDLDDDNDGVADELDAFPLDPSEWLDTDNDNIGNNSDTDDDNDGYEDAADAFPLDPAEWLDTDADGTGNNADTDDDNDGVADELDAFPLDASESHDADSDGIGDNQDLDDDNDGTPDTQDHILLNGAQSSYLTGELINLRIKGFGDNFEVLSANDGWHLQYFTYDQASPNSYLTKYIDNGYYNGVFDYNAMEWVVSFPAVEYSGSFQTKVSVYCSKENGICGDHHNSDGWQQYISYTVECASGGTCEYEPDPEPGVNLTNQTTETSYASSLITRRNGDLLALYTSGFGYSRVVMSTSTDNGQTWSAGPSPASPQNTSSSGGFLFEDSSNNLFLTTSCNVASICVFKYEYNNWSALSEIDLSGYTTCETIEGCMINTFEPRSMVQLPSGKYVLSYIAAPGDDYRQTNVYVRTSYDLRSWTDEKLVGGYEGSDSRARTILLPDSRVLMTYYSSDLQAIIVSISSDGELFSEIQRLPSNAPSSPSLIEHNGVIRLFYTNYDVIYMRKFNDNDQFSDGENIKNIDSFAPLITELSDETLGIIYSKSLNEQVDVFYENIGKLEN